MNTIEIEREMARCSEANGIFKGVFPSDMLPVISSYPAGVICNEDPSNSKGSHWLAFYVTKTLVEFFDSYGRDPFSICFPKSFGDFIGQKQCVYNEKMLEGIFDKTCGEFAIYFTCNRAKGFSFENIIRSFSVDPIANHNIVLNYLK